MSDKQEPEQTASSDEGPSNGHPTGSHPLEQKELPAAAQRALAEAEARRRATEAEAARKEPEVGGRDGPDPARYGDWEKGGIISDF